MQTKRRKIFCAMYTTVPLIFFCCHQCHQISWQFAIFLQKCVVNNLLTWLCYYLICNSNFLSLCSLLILNVCFLLLGGRRNEYDAPCLAFPCLGDSVNFYLLIWVGNTPSLIIIAHILLYAFFYLEFSVSCLWLWWTIPIVPCPKRIKLASN